MKGYILVERQRSTLYTVVQSVRRRDRPRFSTTERPSQQNEYRLQTPDVHRRKVERASSLSIFFWSSVTISPQRAMETGE